MTFRRMTPAEIEANQFPDGPHLLSDLRELNLVLLEELTGRPIAELKEALGGEGEVLKTVHPDSVPDVPRMP